MKEALARVIHVLKTSNLAPQLSMVAVKDGWMAASDGRIYAAAPVDCRLDFCVSGRELERALNFDEMDMKLADGKLCFTKGRSRIRLSLADLETFFVVEEPDDWRPIPAGYLQALHRASRFTSENATQAWAVGVMNLDGLLVATNNVALAAVEYPESPIEGIVPTWLVDFLSKMDEEPIACWDTASAIYFKFKDDSWIRSKRIEGDAPAQMASFVHNLYERPLDAWKVPDDWRSVYKRTLEFSKRDIHVTADRIAAYSDASEVSTDITTPVPFDTLWDHKFLGPVLDEATHWDIEHCGTIDQPTHTFWYGDRIRGLICGKRRISV